MPVDYQSVDVASSRIQGKHTRYMPPGLPRPCYTVYNNSGSMFVYVMCNHGEPFIGASAS
jgi:hypothetical protein